MSLLVLKSLGVISSHRGRFLVVNTLTLSLSFFVPLTHTHIHNTDLEWKIIYVGSASSEAHDQTLDSVLVGPVPAGRHRFVFQANAPDTAKIPSEDVVGVTVVLLTCSYKSHEFVRVGYYVNNEYTDPEMVENPPAKVVFEKVRTTPLLYYRTGFNSVV